MTFAQIRRVEDGDVEYDAIVIWCPGCASRENWGGLHWLPVSDTQGKRPVWQWNGDLVNVGLEPSILTRGHPDFVCHSFLRNGQWQFLSDSTHPLAGQTVSIEHLPDWALSE